MNNRRCPGLESTVQSRGIAIAASQERTLFLRGLRQEVLQHRYFGTRWGRGLGYGVDEMVTVRADGDFGGASWNGRAFDLLWASPAQRSYPKFHDFGIRGSDA